MKPCSKWVILVLVHCSVIVDANLPPVITSDLTPPLVNEDTPIGTHIFSLQAKDPEGTPLTFRIQGTDLLTIDPRNGVVSVAKALDRESKDALRLMVSVEDVVDGANNNVVQVPLEIVILDANDNKPLFSQSSYNVEIPEDTRPGSTVLVGIQASDLDQVGEVLEVHCENAERKGKQARCEDFEVVSVVRTSQVFKGALILKNKMAYNTNSHYNLILVANDGINRATVPLQIHVKDIQNSPPVFQGSMTAIVAEGDPIGTLVIVLRAEDGDRGNPRKVGYELISNPFGFFTVDPESGELRTAKPLDREVIQSADGMVHLQARAYELEGGVRQQGEDSEAIWSLSITVQDVNDEAPTFNRPEYHVSIPENLPPGTPVPDLDLFVKDADVGSNAVFSIHLEDSSNMFSVEPTSAVGTTGLSLKVARGTLDYENPSQRKFIVLVVATETQSSNHLSSTATVIVTVSDVNDNAPTFVQEAYTATVSEISRGGTLVTTITANDLDTGAFGVNGIKYALLGNGAERFVVDAETGVITVADCSTPGQGNCLDYETRSTYFLSFEATDDGGKGHMSTVPLRISLLDANDNPPRFTQDVYRAVIQEEASEFDPPVVVKAKDPDVTSRITYSIIGGNDPPLFSIDNHSGRISVANASGLYISDSKVDRITLLIEASDGKGSSTCQVRVFVRDINNNSPMFEYPRYEVQIYENAGIGASVAQVSATDADSGANAMIVYSIMKGGYDDFEIQNSTGLVSIARELNFDTRSFYKIEISASDKGQPRLSSVVTLEVHVLDSNDKKPRFVPVTQRVQVSEDEVPGSIVHVLHAEDPDVADDVQLQYAFEGVLSAVNAQGEPIPTGRLPPLQSLFSLDHSTGEVLLASPLDRNFATEITLSVIVADISADSQQTGRGKLVIAVKDVNDFPPSFPEPWSPTNPFLTTMVSEELPVGSHVITIIASDIDSNIGGYAISPESEVLSIDSSTGIVSVKGRLDYEQEREVSATVFVWDTGEPRLSSSATLIVKLTNINDEDPVFSHPIYDATVAEHSPPGTVVLIVSATDKDLGEMGQVTYSLAGDHHKHFAIDEAGRISVAAGPSLDREEMDHVELRVVAMDGGPDDMRRQTSVLVHVTVTDINDHPPRFSQSIFRSRVVEDLPLDPPTPILQVSAIDHDIGINSALVYTLINGTGMDHFFMDPYMGILYPVKKLQAPLEEVVYHLVVEVRDENGTGLIPDTAQIEVSVLPLNEHKPTFVSPALPNMTVRIAENASEPHVRVLTVSAEDQDRGANGYVRYYLREGERNVQEIDVFHLDTETGILSTKKVLDREEKSKYELVLVAKDMGSPISYEALRILTVIVEDVNDNPPLFPKDLVKRRCSFAVVENLPKDVLVGQVQAYDADQGNNARIFYHIIFGNFNSSFYIDKTYGTIFTAKPLDREARSSYDLVIKASDSSTLSEEEMALPDDVSDESVVYVNIKIDDINDSPPEFPQRVYYAGISHKTEIGRLVRHISSRDDDAGINGTLVYSIKSSKLYRPGEAVAVGSIIPSPFNVSKDGDLLTASLMWQYRRHRFQLEVQAREVADPYRADSCLVNVWVWEREELVRIILEQTPEEVMKTQEEIMSTLSEVLEGNAVLDEIRYYTHDNNSISREWTEVLMHVVNATSTVLPVEVVLQRVDRGYGILKESPATAKIRNIYPAFQTELEEEVDARLAGLIALAIVLLVGFISFIAVCCCLRFWVLSPGRSREHLIKRSLDDDLGLNTTENPLWLDQKMKTYEEQELTMQVMSDEALAGVSTRNKPTINNNDGSALNFDGQSNTYATIQKSHGGTIRSLQLKTLQQNQHISNGTITLGEEPGESNDYATLDHLRRTQGPKVPGVETPAGYVAPDIQELASSFTGSTFQPMSLANRPLPQEPENAFDSPIPGTAGPSRYRDGFLMGPSGEPCLVAELI